MMRLGLAFLVGAPFVFVRMPPRIQVAGLVTLVIFTTFFGAAVGMTRARAEGRLARLSLLPIPRWKALADIVLSNAVIDMLQTAPLLSLFILINGSDVKPAILIPLTGFYCATIFLLNMIGVLVGWVMKSNPEVHLIGGISVGIVVFISGLFPTPERIARPIAFIAPWNPVSELARLLEQAVEGVQSAGAMESWFGAMILIAAAGLLVGRFFSGGPRPNGDERR